MSVGEIDYALLNGPSRANMHLVIRRSYLLVRMERERSPFLSHSTDRIHEHVSSNFTLLCLALERQDRPLDFNNDHFADQLRTNKYYSIRSLLKNDWRKNETSYRWVITKRRSNASRTCIRLCWRKRQRFVIVSPWCT